MGDEESAGVYLTGASMRVGIWENDKVESKNSEPARRRRDMGLQVNVSS